MAGYFYKIIEDRISPRGMVSGRIEWTSSEGDFNGGHYLMPVEMFQDFKKLIDYRRTKEKVFIKIDIQGKMIRKNPLKALPKAKGDEFNL